MAQRRMFSLSVVDTDKFSEMPLSAQALYFHLGMHADDDGFIGSPKKIQRAIGCCDDDMRLLVAKQFIVPFNSGVVVISDWKLNNSIKSDRYKPTIYQAERKLLTSADNGRYLLGAQTEPNWNQTGTTGKVSIGKVSELPAIKGGEAHTKPTPIETYPSARLNGRPPADKEELYDRSWMQKGSDTI